MRGECIPNPNPASHSPGGLVPQQVMELATLHQIRAVLSHTLHFIGFVQGFCRGLYLLEDLLHKAAKGRGT